ncbi:ABC transporter ATP-binding protein [Anaerolentibacter hominis]|uniref:ABC transporter ATP-binding protein n=1 Tax=Anaerolentibacter hominis TaxID=3079009 RepID=UPI0031B814B2
MNKILEVSGLKKSYGNVEAVKGIDFYVEEGKLFAFLGPNGAGKSTTIDILCTLLEPDAGTVKINGYTLNKEDRSIRDQIGVVFQDGVLDGLLTVRENLTVRAGFYKKSRREVTATVEQAMKAAEVTEFADRPYGKLSGGQKRRADIARALLNTPKILFLDEPTTGLDPQTRRAVWSMIAKLQRETKMTVFLTTHYMEEAAAADYIIIIDRGEVAAKGRPYELKQKYSRDSLKIKTSQPDQIRTLLEDRGYSFKEDESIITIPLEKTKDALPLLNTAEPYLESFEVVHGTMDDVFLNITGMGVRDHV